MLTNPMLGNVAAFIPPKILIFYGFGKNEEKKGSHKPWPVSQHPLYNDVKKNGKQPG